MIPMVAVVIHTDRHADTEVFVFSDGMKAIAWAAKRAKEFDRFNDLRTSLTSDMARDGWVYFAQYGDGNSIRVQVRNVDAAL